MLLAAAEFLLVIVVVVVLAAGMNASETQERKQPAVTPGLVDWGRSDDAAGRRGGGNWELGMGGLGGELWRKHRASSYFLCGRS